MLSFVVPLKSKKVSKNWHLTCRLFERCLKSICNQDSEKFRVFVVCNEIPEIDFTHPLVSYIVVDFIPPSKVKNPISRADTDKGRRILKGLIEASRAYTTHTMIVDADDCVSKRLAKFVAEHSESVGWYINKGYKYINNDQYIYIKRKEFYRMCGTANIIRIDLLNLPQAPEYNRGYGYYKLYIDHQKVREKMVSNSSPLAPLPFPGAIYVIATGDNVSNNENKLSFNWLNRRRITSSITNEFGLYQIDMI
jgi:hypothetical protein